MGRGQTVGDWIEQIRVEGLENSSNRYYSFYPAKVVEDADESQQGKTQVKIQLLGFSDDHPRAAYPISPYAGANYGFYFPAHKDSSVWVTFDQGDINVPRIHGGWWPNKGQDTESKGSVGAASQKKGAKKPETSHIPAEFCKSDGSSPTARGLKTKAGHVLIFEGDPKDLYVEVSSGKMKTREEPVTNEDGSPVLKDDGTQQTVDVVEIGKKAEKHHRIRLDDQNKEIVIATDGVINDALGLPSDNPTDAEELEGHLRMKIIMRDKDNDRFLQIKTIGDSDFKFHQLNMSDTDKKICIQSTREHFFEIDDAKETSTWSVKDGFKWLLDQKNKLMQGITPGGREITFDDKNKFVQIVAPDNQTFRFDTTGTKLEDTSGEKMIINTSGDLDVDSGGDYTLDTEGNLTETIGGDSTEEVTGTKSIEAAIIEMTSNGTAKLEASEVLDLIGSQVNIAGSQVNIAGGALALITEVFVGLYNTNVGLYNGHFHISALPGVPTGATLAPQAPLVPSAVQTQKTKAT